MILTLPAQLLNPTVTSPVSKWAEKQTQPQKCERAGSEARQPIMPIEARNAPTVQTVKASNQSNLNTDRTDKAYVTESL